MVVRHDIAVGGDEEARALGLAELARRPLAALRSAARSVLTGLTRRHAVFLEEAAEGVTFRQILEETGHLGFVGGEFALRLHAHGHDGRLHRLDDVGEADLVLTGGVLFEIVLLRQILRLNDLGAGRTCFSEEGLRGERAGQAEGHGRSEKDFPAILERADGGFRLHFYSSWLKFVSGRCRLPTEMGLCALRLHVPNINSA
jgi:hypothetical protein